jgi:hypothetical protein
MPDTPLLVRGRAFGRAMRKLSPELRAMDPCELTLLERPTRTDYALRLALWNEIRLAAEECREADPLRVYRGICSGSHWRQNVLSRPEKVAWLLSPAVDLRADLRPLLSHLVERSHALSSLDLCDRDGRPQLEVIRQVLRALEMLERLSHAAGLLGRPDSRS